MMASMKLRAGTKAAASLLVLLAGILAPPLVWALPADPPLPIVWPAGRPTEADGWLVYRQVLNQADSPLLAHDLDMGFAFGIGRIGPVAIDGLAHQDFRFRVTYLGPWNLWARDLVSDLRLRASLELGPTVAALAYRHDCKHDIEGSFGRLAIHDQVEASLAPIEAFVWPWGSGDRLSGSLTGSLAAGLYFPPIFQAATSEPEELAFTLEARLLPLAVAGMGRVFVEGTVEPTLRVAVPMVATPGGWDSDFRFATGFEFSRSTGVGGFRLGLSLQRMVDPWMEELTSPILVWGVEAGFDVARSLR